MKKIFIVCIAVVLSLSALLLSGCIVKYNFKTKNVERIEFDYLVFEEEYVEQRQCVANFDDHTKIMENINNTYGRKYSDIYLCAPVYFIAIYYEDGSYIRLNDLRFQLYDKNGKLKKDKGRAVAEEDFKAIMESFWNTETEVITIHQYG